MCGIAGLVSLDPGQPVSEDIALRMAHALRHRGPDAQTTWRSPSRRCALGHARLRVIDLVTGEQPMRNSDESVTVAFNGEIYNYVLLREELEREGRTFRTTSDTEVLLRAYESWGIDLLERIDGMFAFAIWDERRGRLFLARDRAGKKPLFLADAGGTLAFASEIKALACVPGVDRTFDPGVLPEYLARGYVSAPRTPFVGIRKLRPGGALLLDASGSKEWQYWKLTFGNESTDFDTACGEVRRLTRDAVQRRLSSDVPLGVFLSGGVDSSVVVGLMKELDQGPISTFSIGFSGEASYDETHYAERVATRFGTEHTSFDMRGGHADIIEQLVLAYDEPFGDSSALPTYLLSGLTRDNVTVALTGDGGDEVFGGYSRLAGALLAEQTPRWLLTMARGLSAALPFSDDFRSHRRRLARFVEAAPDPIETRLAKWSGFVQDPMGLLRPDVRAALCPEDPWPRAGNGATPLQRGLRETFESYLPEDLLVKADRCSMAHGLELRSPFLDRRLTEYVARLPDSFKVRGTRTKRILKAAFRDLLPADLLHRKKMGFGAPVPRWLRGEWRPLVEARLLDPDGILFRWLEPDAVGALVRSHSKGDADNSGAIWALLTLELWLRAGLCELPETMPG